MNLRHLQLKQPLDQPRMGAGDEHLGPAVCLADLHHVYPNPVALTDLLALDLLPGGQKRVGKLGAGGEADGYRAVALVHPGDGAGENLVLLGRELVENHAPLRLAHPLDDNLTGGLSGDAAEVFGLDLNAQHIPQLRPGQGLLRVLQADLSVGIVHHLHHVLFDEHPNLALFLVGVHHHVVRNTLVVPLIGGDQGLGDLPHHIFLGNSLFLFNVGDGGEKFLGVQLHIFCCDLFLGHVDLLLKTRRAAAPGPRLSCQSAHRPH